MVVYGEGRYHCPEHGDRPPRRGRARRWRAGTSRTRARCAGAPWAGSSSTSRRALDPRSSYAASKVAQEHYAAAWARQSPGAAVSLRYHNVYGAGMPRDTPYSGVAAMFRSSLERGEAPVVFEDGGQMRDFVHVEDVARANCRAHGRGRPAAGSHSAYNVCSGHPIGIADVARAVADGSVRPGRCAASPT